MSATCPLLAAALLISTASGEEKAPITIKEVPIAELGFPLPTPIALRGEVGRLTEPELKKESEQRGFEPFDNGISTSWIRVSKASDGTLYLVDNWNMSLWIRQGDQWKCQLSNISTQKTFGGAFRWLAIRYLGKGLFAFAETVPGETEEKSAKGFPQAYAITYLLDSKNDRILERSPAYLYDHNPPVKPDKEWFTKYELPPQTPENE